MSRDVSLGAVGDIMLGDSPQVFGAGVGSTIRRRGCSYPFTHVRALLSEPDITIGNLEVAISAFDPKSSPFSSQIYRAQPGVVEGLAASGFDVLSICTNHMMQHGRASFEETVELLRRHGISVVGAAAENLGLSNCALLERNDLGFAFLGYNFRPEQYFLAPPAWPSPSLELIRDDIRAVRSQVDVVVLTFHWGDEFIDYPAPWQVEVAHECIRAGADIIIGHHPHVLQGVERYEGGLIAYSLGNFVFDYWQRRMRLSAVLQVRVRGPREMTYHLEPLVINRAHQPMPLQGRDRDVALSRIRNLDAQVGVSSETEYEEALRSEFRRYRRGVWIHYILNSWRFSPRYLAANVAAVIKKRLPLGQG